MQRCKTARIRSVRIGQKFLIPKAALREFLDRELKSRALESP